MNKKTLSLYCAIVALLASKNAQCDMFRAIDEHMKQMQQEMRNMRQMFGSLEEKFHKQTFVPGIKINHIKNTIDISQDGDKALVNINIGSGIKEFDAKIKTKKDGYARDQIVITTKEPQKNKIFISINGKYLAVEQSREVKAALRPVRLRSCELRRATSAFAKATADRQDDRGKKYAAKYQASSFSIGRTLDHKLDISKTDIEYNDKEGILSVIIPKIKEKDKSKKIKVKIKKQRDDAK